MIDRAILLSHPEFHQKNLNICINILYENGYPLNIIFSEINRRINMLRVKLIHKQQKSHHVKTDIQPKNYIVVPFIKSIDHLVKSSLKSAGTAIAYRCINQLMKYIHPHKDADDLMEKNNVIYRISCKDCQATYVGQTKRKLGIRIKEHKSNIRLDPSRHSVVSNHITSFDHEIDWHNIKILDIEHNYQKRLIGEMIHIKSQKLSINAQTDTESLHESYADVIKELALFPRHNHLI